MKLSAEYFVSGLIAIIGLLSLIFKFYYEPYKRVNLKKASIYQGWVLIILYVTLLCYFEPWSLRGKGINRIHPTATIFFL